METNTHSNNQKTQIGLRTTGIENPKRQQEGCEGNFSSHEELQLLNRALRAINQCNQSLIHAGDEQELLHQICAIAVEIGGYRLAWVGYAEHDAEKTVRPVAQAGFDGNYLKTMHITWADVDRGRVPAGKSIRTGQPAISRNMLTDPSFEPWRKEALARGYASVLCLPLKAVNEVFGCLCIYSSLPDAFDTEETRLLRALADNLAYGVVMLRTRKAHAEAAEKLRESESEYRSLFENNHTVMLIIDPLEGSIVDANPAASSYYGWTHDELCRMNIKQINQLTNKEVQAEMQRSRNEKRNYFLFSHHLADGTNHNVEVYSGPITIKQKSLLYSIIHDITDRKRVESQLLETHTRFTQALEATHAGVWQWDVKTGENIWSDEIWALYGLERETEKPSHQLWRRSIHPDDKDEIVRTVVDAEKNAIPIAFEHRVFHRDGREQWLMAKGQPLFDEKGDLEFYIGTIFDITDRKRIEEERESLQVQLHQEQKMQMLGQLAGGIAHDFNNMLTVILGHAELALERYDSSFDDLEAIKKAAAHSAELTGQLLAFARMQTVAAKIFDLNSSVQEMLSILRRMIGNNIKLIWIPKVKDAFVKLDPSQIIQILTNLCVNARDAISETGNITIETDKILVDQAKINAGHPCTIPGDYITLSITDNGFGIDKKLLPHISEPFFTTKGVGKGSGMGLATVYGIVKQGKGCIDVQSEKGKGTRIIIYLPLQQEQAPPVKGDIEEPVLPHGKGMILLVDDQPDILLLCRKMLEYQGYTVLAASDPQEAIELAEKKREDIDLLVTDVIMPEMNGSELFKKIEPSCPKLNVLYMSGYTTDFITQKLRDDEGVNFIEKPFSIKAFTKTVQNILKKQPKE